MAFSNTTILYIIELAIYLLLAPFILYLWRLHGKHGFLAFMYIHSFAILRIVSDIIFIIQRNNRTPSTAASIVSSIGLSPLLLALAGLIHEEHVYLVFASYTPTRAKQVNKYMWIAQILFHVVSAAAIAILIIGITGVITSQKQGQTPKSADLTKREVGSVLLLLLWITLAAYAAWVLRAVVRTSSPVRTTLRVYSLCILAGSFFIGIRTVYTVVSAFDHSASLSPITGSFVVKLVLVVLVQLGAVLLWLVGAWTSKTIKNEHSFYQPARSGSPSDGGEAVPLQQGYSGPTSYKSGQGSV